MKLTFLNTLVALTFITTGAIVGCNESTSKPKAAPAPSNRAVASDSAPSEPTTLSREVSAPAGGENAATSDAITTEWNQWGGSPARNNTPVGKNIPSEWNHGGFDLRTGDWKRQGAKNMKWVAKLGSESYGNLAVSGGKIFVGTNNAAGWIERYPHDHDLGCLLAFDVKDGKFLWQHSSEKLPTGRVHDWPEQGVCSGALVEGNRLWFVTNRGEVRCLDTEGFHDGENDGPYVDEEVELKKSAKPYDLKKEADVIWVYDMMKEMRISQHNMASCSITSAGDLLFVCTSNGVDVEHNYIPAPDAPSFFAMNKNTKEVLWTDNSPGLNILHGQWSSPAYGLLGGVPQVIFAGGDGWLRSFDPNGDGQGKAKLLWEFDCNPKTSFYTVNARATRNHLIATPVIYEGLVYIAVGEDPEHDEGIGHLWCIDPTKRGDVSAELAFKGSDRSKPLPHRRLQAVVEEDGEIAVPNPNSAAVWHYSEFDQNGDGKAEFEETMHRTMGSVAIKDNVLYIADFSGLFHCLDAKTGKAHWTYDMMGQSWGTPLIVDGKVYMGDADGDVAVFRHSADPNVAMKEVDGQKKPYYGEMNMNSSVYTTPIVAGNVLFMTSMNNLFAIESKPEN
ncbi:MAG: PQQ-binding-like beta-propeller repeat protein [Pirellulales bacterium]